MDNEESKRLAMLILKHYCQRPVPVNTDKLFDLINDTRYTKMQLVMVLHWMQRCDLVTNHKDLWAPNSPQLQRIFHWEEVNMALTRELS